MNIRKKTKELAVVLSFVGASCGIADILDTPTANLTERWTSGDVGWVIKDNVAMSTRPVVWTNGAIGVTFAPRRPDDFPTPELVGISGAGAASYGRFVGDYNLRGIESVAFTIITTNLSKHPVFYFKTTANKEWHLTLVDVPFTTDVNGILKVVPLGFSAAWVSSEGASYATPENFESDKASVGEIGIGIARYTELAQQASIDNLKLIGPWGGPLTNSMPLAWVMENNLAPSSIDSDGDGFSNVAEYLAGTDPNDSNSFFRVEIGRNASGKMVVKWTENKYVYFDLMQTTNIMEPATFQIMSNAADLPGSGGVREIEVSDSGSAGVTKFYKVVIKSSPSVVK